MTPNDYQQLAEVTKSNSFFGEYITIREMMDVLNQFIEVTAKLDKLKKKLFYGRYIGLDETGSTDRRQPIGQTLAAIPGMTGRDETIMHSLLGFATEGGENAEILRDWLAEYVLTGKVPEWDCVKLAEEQGGLWWYGAIQANATKISIEQTFVINIEQLRKRFGGKFTAHAANQRNLEAEHAAMVAATPKTTMVDVAAPRLCTGCLTADFNHHAPECEHAHEAAVNLAAAEEQLALVRAGKHATADDEIERYRAKHGV